MTSSTDTRFSSGGGNGTLWYRTTRYDSQESIIGGRYWKKKKSKKASKFIEVKAIKFVGAPAAVAKVKQRMVTVLVRNAKDELEEWVFDGREWDGPKVRATGLASSPIASGFSAHKFHVSNTKARFVRHYSCKGNWPDAEKVFSDLTKGGCWTCNGAKRTLAAVDSSKACEQWDFTRMSVYYLGKDDRIHWLTRDIDGGWEEKTSLPAGPKNPPFRVPDSAGLVTIQYKACSCSDCP